MPDNRTYRIKANIQGEDFVNVNLNLNQDVNVFEFLSLNIDTENFYRFHTANYGCVAGRVLANNAVGVPNVKISIFIAADENTDADAILHYLYPYKNTMDKNSDGIRYNLLPEEQLFQCHQNVGTFPLKRMVLDDNNVLEIFDKYYKFTTTTNSAGDYMIFGVPVGTQILHMDVDLSDIGDLLSQRPRDFIYKGYDVNQFENANMFKKDKNLGTLTQIFTQNESVNVHPFWGEVSEMGEVDSTGVRITRKDINLNYKFEPTCVFMGSLITDEKSNGFTKRCIPTERMGKMDRITTGEGTIEMIRKTPDGKVEEFSIMGNQLIDGNGTWCYQIPMNLDYVKTDEWGNIVATNDIKKGLPTRASVRFRFSLNDFASDYQNNHLTKMLVPNNPMNVSEMSETYAFGTKTPDSEFRDLFWNKVYSVKSYIPRLQKSNTNREKRFSGIKAVNVNVGNNPIPYNNMRIDITFMFVLQCAIMHILIWIAGAVNAFLKGILKIDSCGKGDDIREGFDKDGSCVTVGDGACPDLDGWYFAPKCADEIFGKKKNHPVNPMRVTLRKLTDKEGDPDYSDSKSLNNENKDDASVCLTNKIDYFVKCIEMSLAQEYEVIQFDFYNDWINGLIYIPRWFANIKKKRKYLFGLVGPKKTKVQACMEGSVNYQRRYVQQCALEYKKDDNSKYSIVSSANGCVPGKNKSQRCHKGKGRKNVKILKNTNPGGGYIHDEQTMRGEYVYYFRPCDWYGGDRKKINYFATDIILLGSLSNHDMDGVPQSFKELTSSSYQMPTNIAATNMDTVAYMYGVEGSGSMCSGNNAILDVQQNENTFEAYQKWARNTDYGDDIDNDPNEYEVTEAAGIDWGYTGPGQRYLLRQAGSKKEYADYNNSFYQPGGHFLGIACFNAESNVKSCVNLSRICEFGVTMSQRQAIVRRNGDVLEDDKAFLVPTGLISKDEISDGGFRSEFATLNHNGLATRINPDTKRREYVFISMQPNNFDGSLAQKTTSAAYNNLNGVREPEGSSYVSATAYTRTIEDKSVDYYDFRLGVGNVDWDSNKRSIDDKYLITNGNFAYLPMYNNSYYFYFGLRDGSTALDRFYKEFFAQCPDINEGKLSIKVLPTGIPACSNERGSVVIILNGDYMDSPINYTLKRDGVQVSGVSGIYPTGTMGLTINNLLEGSYEIIFSSDLFEDISRKFSIIKESPEWLSEIKIDIEDFKKTYYDEDGKQDPNEFGGIITIDTFPDEVISYSVTNKDGTHSGKITKDQHSLKLWTDEEYIVRAIYKCRAEQSAPYPDIEIYRFTLSMPKEFDLFIGGNVVTYNRVIRGKLSNNNWWAEILSKPGRNKEIEIEKFYVEKAVAFRGSLFNGDSGSIEVTPAYGDTPYEINAYGDGEQLGDTEISGTTLYLSSSDDGYDLNYRSFLYPTMNEPLSPIGYVLRNSNGVQITNKNNYSANFIDKNGTGARIPSDASQNLVLPSIYKPFFVRCAIVKNALTSVISNRYSLTIVNGALYKRKFNSIRVCSLKINPEEHNQGQWWELTGGNVEDFRVQWYKGPLPARSNINYSVYVKEGGAEITDPVYEAKEIAETVRFIGDGGVPDSTVRYFMLFRANEHGYRQKSPDPNANYMDVLRDYLVEKISFSDDVNLKDGQIGDEIYWSGSCTKAFKIDLKDGGYLFFNPKYEINRSKIFSGDLSAIDEANKNTSDCFVLGVYDPWTQLSDEDFASAQNDAQISDVKWRFTGKDSDMLAIFKLYPVDKFISLVQNPNMYPEISDTDDDTQDSFSIQTTAFREIIEAGYDEYGEIEHKTVSGTSTIAEFNINDNQKQINIPEFKIVLDSPDVSEMITMVNMYLQNEGDEKNRVNLKMFAPHGSADNTGKIHGDATVRSMADTVMSRDIGTGRYKLNVEYEMELQGQYGAILSGSMTIASEKIQVITV